MGFGHEPVLGGESVVGGRRHEEHRALREAMGYRRGEEIQGGAFVFHTLRSRGVRRQLAHELSFLLIHASVIHCYVRCWGYILFKIKRVLS